GSGSDEEITVPERFGERERARCHIKPSVHLAEKQIRHPQREIEINRYGLRIAARRQMGGRGQRRFEGHRSLAEVATRHCPQARLLCVRYRLVPPLTALSMLREPVDLLIGAAEPEPFDGLHEARVKRTPPVRQQRPVGYLLRQRVLEGVLGVGKELDLV